jgi:hypothetical protein
MRLMFTSLAEQAGAQVATAAQAAAALRRRGSSTAHPTIDVDLPNDRR